MDKNISIYCLIFLNCGSYISASFSSRPSTKIPSTAAVTQKWIIRGQIKIALDKLDRAKKKLTEAAQDKLIEAQNELIKAQDEFDKLIENNPKYRNILTIINIPGIGEIIKSFLLDESANETTILEEYKRTKQALINHLNQKVSFFLASFLVNSIEDIDNDVNKFIETKNNFKLHFDNVINALNQLLNDIDPNSEQLKLKEGFEKIFKTDIFTSPILDQNPNDSPNNLIFLSNFKPFKFCDYFITTISPNKFIEFLSQNQIRILIEILGNIGINLPNPSMEDNFMKNLNDSPISDFQKLNDSQKVNLQKYKTAVDTVKPHYKELASDLNQYKKSFDSEWIKNLNIKLFFDCLVSASMNIINTKEQNISNCYNYIISEISDGNIAESDSDFLLKLCDFLKAKNKKDMNLNAKKIIEAIEGTSKAIQAQEQPQISPSKMSL